MAAPLEVWVCPDCGENVGRGRSDYEGVPGHIHEGRFDFRAAEKVEVVPVSSPQVLSVEEAREVKEALVEVGWCPDLWRRLSDWVEKEGD
jgi:hypothetical protein